MKPGKILLGQFMSDSFAAEPRYLASKIVNPDEAILSRMDLIKEYLMHDNWSLPIIQILYFLSFEMFLYNNWFEMRM
jgi:hypothetical protein